jgi:hypothetical protein
VEEEVGKRTEVEDRVEVEALAEAAEGSHT